MGRKGLHSEKKHGKKKKRNSSSSSSSISLSSLDEDTRRKLQKKLKKLRKKEKKKKKEKKEKVYKKLLANKSKNNSGEKDIEEPNTSVVSEALFEKSKSLAPMTKEEWEKQQNTLTRVFDKETGRMRLIKGTGEIVEECVSRERHLAINKQQPKKAMEKSDVVEKFYGVYLLKCLNPKYKGRTYIGFTVDPNRRIKQHNKGKDFGGAWKTSQRGPWEMTLTVHGFPSEVAALRFEWAWQHPKQSRRLRNIIANKKSSETSFDYCLKVMFTMLTVPPWCRLPLTIRWLSPDVVVEPPPNLTPPMHMPIVFGPVQSKKLKSPKKKGQSDRISEELETQVSCELCHDNLDEENILTCLNSKCKVNWHILCVAKHFLENENSFTGTQSSNQNEGSIIPVEGTCPTCQFSILWGDLIRKKKWVL